MEKFVIGVYTYGALRTAAYSPPLKKDEYMTDRIGTTLVYILSTPFTVPIWIYKDIKNLEHVVRKMPGPIDRTPWT